MKHWKRLQDTEGVGLSFITAKRPIVAPVLDEGKGKETSKGKDMEYKEVDSDDPRDDTIFDDERDDMDIDFPDIPPSANDTGALVKKRGPPAKSTTERPDASHAKRPKVVAQGAPAGVEPTPEARFEYLSTLLKEPTSIFSDLLGLLAKCSSLYDGSFEQLPGCPDFGRWDYPEPYLPAAFHSGVNAFESTVRFLKEYIPMVLRNDGSLRRDSLETVLLIVGSMIRDFQSIQFVEPDAMEALPVHVYNSVLRMEQYDMLLNGCTDLLHALPSNPTAKKPSSKRAPIDPSLTLAIGKAFIPASISALAIDIGLTKAIHKQLKPAIAAEWVRMLRFWAQLESTYLRQKRFPALERKYLEFPFPPESLPKNFPPQLIEYNKALATYAPFDPQKEVLKNPKLGPAMMTWWEQSKPDITPPDDATEEEKRLVGFSTDELAAFIDSTPWTHPAGKGLLVVVWGFTLWARNISLLAKEKEDYLPFNNALTGLIWVLEQCRQVEA
ncbi:hypothetical protein ONZ45_g19252 [Pleurotus djamor]|nr:hypothetical protein ONZ45_g19252 [Pleurotus djamor]